MKRFENIFCCTLVFFALCGASRAAWASSRYSPLLASTASQDTLRNLALWEDQRVTGDGQLFAYLGSNNPLVRLRAVEVIGRIQDPQDTAHLIPMLRDTSPAVVAETCFALGQIGSEEAIPALADFCDVADSRFVARAAEAAGKIGGSGGVALLTELIHDFNSDVRAQAALGLARAADSAAINALLLAIHDPDPHVAAWAVYGLEKVESKRAAEKVLPFLSHDDAMVRSFAARTLGKQKYKDAIPALRMALGDPDIGVAVSAARALGEIGEDDGIHPLGKMVKNHPSPQGRRAAIEALGTIGSKKGKDYVIQALLDPSVGVRVTAIGALAAILGKGVELFAEQATDDGSRLVRAAGIEAMGAAGLKSRVDLLMKIARTDDPMMRAAAVRALGAIHDGRVAEFLVGRLDDEDWVVTTEVVEAIGEHDYRDAAPALINAYQTRTRREDVNIRIAVLDVLTRFRAVEAEPLARDSLDDRDIRVRTNAAALLEVLEVPARLPGEREMYEAHFDATRMRALMPPTGVRHAVITTVHGEIEVELFGDNATQTVASFVDLAQKGFYDGLTFHRVVPNFVVQGGDPRGDGWGDAGYFIRSEFNHYRYSTGMLGIAHDGKDTGGCQFFITHSPQHRLDGRYTIFGRVTGGMDVVYRIDQGDTFSVRIID